MKILVVGSGGREHALAWKALQSPMADLVYVAPGNAGTALEPGVENVDIPVEDIQALAEFAEDEGIGLTIIGPDRPGLVERLARTLSDHDANWLESRMARLAGKFAGILLASVPESRAEELTQALRALESMQLAVQVGGPGIAAAARHKGGGAAQGAAAQFRHRPGQVSEP